MAIPTTRATFKEFCLRALGKPVIKINLDDDQIEDRIDFSLKKFMDYHFDGNEKIYFKYLIEPDNKPDRVYRLNVDEAGTGYSNGAVTITSADGNGEGATGTITTNGAGAIQSATVTAAGDDYAVAPTVTLSGGTGGAVSAELGGWVEMPENVIGVVNIFDSGLGTSTNDLFSIQYQLVANDLLALTSTNLAPYFMMMTHLASIQQLLVGRKPIRYNRYKNKLYIDMNWNSITDSTYLIAEAYEVIDPDEWPKVWSDQWLQQYATAQIKMVWGTVLKRYGNMPLPNGITMNGQQMYDEAIDEINELDRRLIRDYSIPVTDMIG